MKNIMYLLIVTIMIACNTADKPSYRVISYNGSDASMKVAEGDTIGATAMKLKLNASESMLLSDMAGELVYRITGPQVLYLKDIEKGELETFNAKYFSLITDNLSKPSAEVRHAVLGGVSRGAGMGINYFEKERILAQSLKPILSSHEEEACNVELSIEDEPIDDYNYRDNNVFDLKAIRTANEDVELIVRGTCGHHMIERCLVIVSGNGIREVLQEEARMGAEKFPDEALINYYIKNKLFDRARRLGGSMENPSPAVRQILDIIKS